MELGFMGVGEKEKEVVCKRKEGANF